MATGNVISKVATLYTDAACTQAATAQQVIDAFSAGGAQILAVSGSGEVMMTAASIMHSTISTPAEGGETSPIAVLIVVEPANGTIMRLGLME